MGKGLAVVIGLGKPKPGADEGEEESPPSSVSGSEQEELDAAKAAYKALEDKEPEAFQEAFVTAVRACVKRAMSDGYDDHSEEG